MLYDVEEVYAHALNRFISVFTQKWRMTLSELNYAQDQLVNGARLRPQIALWGYLSTKSPEEIHCDDLVNIAEIGVSIELLHKASLLFDDWFDQDDARRGKPTFHTENTPEITVALALHMVALAAHKTKHLTSTHAHPSTGNNQCLNILLDIIFSMSKGVLSELQLTTDDIVNFEKIKNIAYLETSVIISKSFLMGYELAEKVSPQASLLMSHIGNNCGYAFQVLNDLEALGNHQKNMLNKGKANYDIDRNRKNIVLAILYELLSKKEKKQLYDADYTTLQALSKKYNLLSFIHQDISRLFKKMLEDISSLQQYGVSEQWVAAFSSFIVIIRDIAFKRVKIDSCDQELTFPAPQNWINVIIEMKKLKTALASEQRIPR